MFCHVEYFPHDVNKNRQTILCVRDPKLNYVTFAKKEKEEKDRKKRGDNCGMFQFGPA